MLQKTSAVVDKVAVKDTRASLAGFFSAQLAVLPGRSWVIELTGSVEAQLNCSPFLYIGGKVDEPYVYQGS